MDCYQSWSSCGGQTITSTSTTSTSTSGTNLWTFYWTFYRWAEKLQQGKNGCLLSILSREAVNQCWDPGWAILLTVRFGWNVSFNKPLPTSSFLCHRGDINDLVWLAHAKTWHLCQKISTNKMNKCCLAMQSAEMAPRSHLSAVARSLNLDIYTFTQDWNGGMLQPSCPFAQVGPGGDN